MAIYQWTTDDDEVAFDAVTVGIGSDAAALEAAGLSAAPPLANVYWPDWITGGDKVKAAMEGPYSVPDALERAETLCAPLGVLARRDRAPGPGDLAPGMGRAPGDGGIRLMRIPDTGPEARRRADALAIYRRKLAYFRSVPPHLREAEHADEGERDMLKLIEELEAGNVRPLHQ